MSNLEFDNGCFIVEDVAKAREFILEKIKSEDKKIVLIDEKLNCNNVEPFAEEFEFDIKGKATGGHCLFKVNYKNYTHGPMKINKAEKNFDVYKEISGTKFHRGHILARQIVKQFSYFQKSKKKS